MLAFLWLRLKTFGYACKNVQNEIWYLSHTQKKNPLTSSLWILETKILVSQRTIWLWTHTSSGTFSHSPFVVSSFFAGFCLSFLLNENERNDHRFFFSFFCFLLLSGVSFSSGFAVTSLLSFNVSSFVPFSIIFGASPIVSSKFSFDEIFSFSVAISFSFSASSFVSLISLS